MFSKARARVIVKIDSAAGRSYIMGRLVLLAAATVLLSGPATEAWAESYWTYAYKDFDVVTYGTAGGAHAVELAQNLARLDQAVAGIVGTTDKHPPTHIYLLPAEEATRLLGPRGGDSAYQFNGSDVTVVANQEARKHERDWGALVGYTDSLMVSGRFAHYPYWFRVGVPALFAHSEFTTQHVKTGGSDDLYARKVVSSNLILMRTFLRAQAGDGTAQGDLFEAESWFLAHEIFV
jgi:hypothetical protein